MKKRGYTLIELLLYTGILIILVAVVGGTLLAFSRSYRSIAAEQALEQGAGSAMQRIVYEARNATSIDVVNSTFNSSPGKLSLNSSDQSGNPQVIQFFLSSSTLHVSEAGVDKGPITPAAARVTSLIFRSITASSSKAIKIEITVESGTSSAYRTRSFYDTAILRPSYTQ